MITTLGRREWKKRTMVIVVRETFSPTSKRNRKVRLRRFITVRTKWVLHLVRLKEISEVYISSKLNNHWIHDEESVYNVSETVSYEGSVFGVYHVFTFDWDFRQFCHAPTLCDLLEKKKKKPVHIYFVSKGSEYMYTRTHVRVHVCMMNFQTSTLKTTLDSETFGQKNIEQLLRYWFINFRIWKSQSLNENRLTHLYLNVLRTLPTYFLFSIRSCFRILEFNLLSTLFFYFLFFCKDISQFFRIFHRFTNSTHIYLIDYLSY